jgi:hypothetical protein
VTLTCGDLEAGGGHPIVVGGSTPTSPLHSHQKRIRMANPEPMLVPRLSLLSPLLVLPNGLLFGVIPQQIGAHFIERHEWLGHAGRAFKNYGMWNSDGHLFGVEAFQPAALGLHLALGTLNSLVLSRGACVLASGPNAASMLIGACLRDLRRQGFQFVVAFADPMAGETGGAYRAANARDLGVTKTRMTYYKVGERSVSAQRIYQEGIDGGSISGTTKSPARRVFGWLLDRSCAWPTIWNRVNS